MRVLVCAATRAEHGACARGIGARHEVLLTGVGPARAARTLAERLARGALPDLVVSSGFAGALTPTLALGSWITGARVSEWDGALRLSVDVELVCAPGLVRCEVVSSSALVAPSDVPGAATTPLVADMESAALAREARRRGVAFAIVRLISDTPAHPLPAFVSPFAAALAATTTASRLAAAGRGLAAAAARPRDVVRLVTESGAWLRGLEDGWRALGAWPPAA